MLSWITDLESEPLTGKQEKKDPSTFADPQAISSYRQTNIYLICNNVHEKHYVFLIGLKQVHSHVTWVQSCNMSANYKKRMQAFKISPILIFSDAFFIYIINK